MKRGVKRVKRQPTLIQRLRRFEAFINEELIPRVMYSIRMVQEMERVVDAVVKGCEAAGIEIDLPEPEEDEQAESETPPGPVGDDDEDAGGGGDHGEGGQPALPGAEAAD